MAHGELRLEVWSRPGASPFERIDIAPPGPFSGTKRQAGSIGRGQLTVPVTYDRLNDLIKRTPGNPSTDVRRLARIYAEGVTLPVHEFFLDNTGDEAVETDVTLDGADINSIPADAIVQPWDWDGNNESESRFPDWVWGGRELVGPVEVTFAPHIVEVWNTGAVGSVVTFGVSVNGAGYLYTTWDFDASSFEVEQALEGMGLGLTVEVIGDGTEDNHWRITILGPSNTYVTAMGASPTGGISRMELLQFGKLVPTGWTISLIGSTNLPHGQVTDFRASLGGGADPAVPAGCDYWIVFDGQEQYFPGVQKRIKVTPHAPLYNPPVTIIRSSSATTFRVVVRDLNEMELGSEEITVAANTDTNITGFQVDVPDGVYEAVYRIGHIGTGDPGPTYIACPSLREGLPPDTFGAEFDLLFDDATLNHVADDRVAWENGAAPGTTYLIPTYTSIVDSAGVTWDNPEVEITIKRGMNYQQVLQAFANRGYRWSITPSNTAGLYHLNLYNPTWLKVDATALSTPAINVGSGVTSGPIVRSHLVGNAITVEGNQLMFGRALSAGSIAAIGRREVYQPDKTITTAAGASTRAAQEVAARLLAGLSVAVNVDPVGAPVPLVDYDVDWNVNVQIPPALPKSAHRVAAITYNVADSTKYSASFSSESFTGAAGVIEGTRRLLEKFDGFDREAPDIVDTPMRSIPKSIFVIVAADNSPQFWKDVADFQCDGTLDDIEIQLAFNFISVIGGWVILAPGDYTIATSLTLAGMFHSVILWGQGAVLHCTTSITNLTFSGRPIFGNANCASGLDFVPTLYFEGLTFDGDDVEDAGGITIQGTNLQPHVVVRNVVMQAMDGHFIYCDRGDNRRFDIVQSNFINSAMAGTANAAPSPAAIQFNDGGCKWRVRVMQCLFENVTIPAIYGALVDLRLADAEPAIAHDNIVEDCTRTGGGFVAFEVSGNAFHHNWINGTWTP